MAILDSTLCRIAVILPGESLLNAELGRLKSAVIGLTGAPDLGLFWADGKDGWDLWRSPRSILASEASVTMTRYGCVCARLTGLSGLFLWE